MTKSLPCIGVIYRKEDNMLTLKEFQNVIIERLYLYMPGYKNIEVKEVEKITTNDTIYHGISVSVNGEIIVPLINLGSFFEKYKEGSALDTLLNEIAHIAISHLTTSDKLKHFLDFNYVKNKIIFYVVNTKRNQKFLSTKVHKEFEDLSLIYKVVMDEDSEGIETITVEQNHLNIWGISADELHKIAKENTRKIATISTIREHMVSTGHMSEFQAQIEFPSPSPLIDMYIATTKYDVNGAAAMFCKDIFKELANQLDTNLYIIPESVHEVLVVSELVKELTEECGNSLTDLVKLVNTNVLEAENFLSDNVYFYNSETGCISLAEELKKEDIA